MLLSAKALLSEAETNVPGPWVSRVGGWMCFKALCVIKWNRWDPRGPHSQEPTACHATSVRPHKHLFIVLHKICKIKYCPMKQASKTAKENIKLIFLSIFNGKNKLPFFPGKLKQMRNSQKLGND